jgi:hypothetical protein
VVSSRISMRIYGGSRSEGATSYVDFCVSGLGTFTCGTWDKGKGKLEVLPSVEVNGSKDSCLAILVLVKIGDDGGMGGASTTKVFF